MVRVMASIGNSEDSAQKAVVELASEAAAELPAFVPN
jgi:hypothetical protein